MNSMQKLHAMRQAGGPAITQGLSDDALAPFLTEGSALVRAIDEAHAAWEGLADDAEFIAMDESEQIERIQADFVNFYADDAVNPYVALGGCGPWIVTLKGAVLHDSGGYGMLGLGHAPRRILDAMNGHQVMANVMTPNISQMRLANALKREIGHRRGGCPFDRFLCLNSGSEAVSLAARISDINARNMTDPGGRHANKPIHVLSLKGGFHGRTDRPARYSDSTRRTYSRYLASYRDHDNLITVTPNDLEQLEQVFRYANQNNLFIESFFMEPVMGEGNPGQAITPEFYARARELTKEHGCLLLVDSIQAGLRAHGVLSIVDYPGFEGLEPPDMESYSKALNAGQYPLSVLALTGPAAALYRKGVYGNTMTSNPRAMDVARAVLDQINEDVRRNIVERGHEFLEKLGALKDELGDRIRWVQGTGLLFSVELDGERYKAYGANSIEEFLRMRGINVIHGGENSLRFTPHFLITSEEVDLIVDATREALLKGPMKATASESAAA